MPTYEYRCPKGHDFERFYKTISGAAAEVECPECGAVAGRQLSGGAGLLFKGSGFYLTDYGKNAHRGEKPASSAGDDSKPKAEGAKAESPKAESTKPKAEPAKSESPKSESPKPAPKKPKAE